MHRFGSGLEWFSGSLHGFGSGLEWFSDSLRGFGFGDASEWRSLRFPTPRSTNKRHAVRESDGCTIAQ